MTKLIKKIISITALMITATDFAQGSYQEECIPISCCYSSCGKFFLDAQIIYFRAFEGGLSSPCDSTQIINTTENDRIVSKLKGKNHDLDFKWNLGFTVGAGYKFENSNSSIGTFWTNYNSHTGRGKGENEHHWEINFNVVDVLYCYEYNWSTCFALIPFGGLRYGKIDQHIRTHFVSTENGIPTISHANSKENFSGLGPLFGIEGNWGIGCGFSLYGSVSASILYGRFHVRSNHTDEFDTGINRDHLKSNMQACQPVVDLGFGIRWKTCFCNNKILVLQLGLEEHRYFNHNQFCGYGDLSLDGGSFTLSIEY